MDKDLEFLRDVDDKYLDVLVNVMINYDGGKGKIKAIKEEYTKFGTSYKNYLDDIVDTYINYGNDAYANITKGIKNSYRHILSDVCSSFKIDYDVNKSLEDNEQLVLNCALNEVKDNLSIDKSVDLIIELYANIKQTNFDVRWREFLQEFLIINIVTIPSLELKRMMDSFKKKLEMVNALIIDLYQKGKPELQVTIPCTLLIALFRKTISV